jgi:hypothetical protein
MNAPTILGLDNGQPGSWATETDGPEVFIEKLARLITINGLIAHLLQNRWQTGTRADTERLSGRSFLPILQISIRVV